MIKQASDEPDKKRYWPSPIEEKHLRYYMNIYLKFPERSNCRNKIAKEASQVLVKLSPHWNHRNVRLWFNNNMPINLNKKIVSDNAHIPEINITSKEESQTVSINDSMREKRCIKKSIQENIGKKCELMRSIKKENNETFSEGSIKNHSNLKSIKNPEISVQTHQKYISNIIFNDLNKNKGRYPNGRRYTDEMIDYCFLIKNGPNPYDDFRYFLPVPCVKTLKNRREKDIDKLKNEIVNDGEMSEVIKMRLDDFTLKGEKIKAVLSIDAIEIALFRKVNELIKNLFLLFFIPVNIPEKPFPVKVITHENGKVGKSMLDIINEKIAQTFFENPLIDLQYKAVDGDSGYNGEFEDEFEILFNYFVENGLNGLSEFVDELKKNMLQKKKWLILTDMVHFLKNRRTQLIISSLELNEIQVYVECLENVLFQSAAILDTSSLSKLQDTFPIEIFNFQVFSGVLECGNYD